MVITIQPLDIEAYEEVLALWQKSEGVGLSGADSRENIRSYLTAVGVISTTWLFIRNGGGRGSAGGWRTGVSRSCRESVF
jgi:hypothetical protein